MPGQANVLYTGNDWIIRGRPFRPQSGRCLSSHSHHIQNVSEMKVKKFAKKSAYIRKKFKIQDNHSKRKNQEISFRRKTIWNDWLIHLYFQRVSCFSRVKTGRVYIHHPIRQAIGAGQS
jgi:hypothetical protein